MSLSISVLSACSGTKAVDPVGDCRAIDESGRAALIDEHPGAAMDAKSLYTGDEHEYVKTAIEQLATVADVDWRIISAGFGLVTLDTVLPAYECTFKDDVSVRHRVERTGEDSSGLTRAERIEIVAKDLGIPSGIEEWLTATPEVLFVALGRDYLLATGTTLSSIPAETTAFAFAPGGSRDLVGDCRRVPSTETERAAIGTTRMRLKGRQLRNIAQQVTTAEDLTEVTVEELRKMSIREKE